MELVGRKKTIFNPLSFCLTVAMFPGVHVACAESVGICAVAGAAVRAQCHRCVCVPPSRTNCPVLLSLPVLDALSHIIHCCLGSPGPTRLLRNPHPIAQTGGVVHSAAPSKKRLSLCFSGTLVSGRAVAAAHAPPICVRTVVLGTKALRKTVWERGQVCNEKHESWAL